jgi:hypothetical protein
MLIDKPFTPLKVGDTIMYPMTIAEDHGAFFWVKYQVGKTWAYFKVSRELAETLPYRSS